MRKEIDQVKKKLEWMREQRIWPNGLRYLWTDAFGVSLLVSLYQELGETRYLMACNSYFPGVLLRAYPESKREP